jgi:small conductance mechanosensitive channel
MGDYLRQIVSEGIQEKLQGATAEDVIAMLVFWIIAFLIFILVYALICMIMMKIVKAIFKRIKNKKGNSITIQFMQRAVELALIVVFIILPLGGKKIAQSLLGSTAVIAVVAGLAANEVLKDMFAGLELSIYKPFDVGSRIMLEDGTAGIVEKMTLRHVVVMLLDTTRLIVPNSKANSGMIVNYSYLDTVPRSLELKFPIGYTSDIEKAKEIVRKTICDCPLTLNEDKYKEDEPNSRSVYFLSLGESSLILGATVKFPHEIRTEVVKDEINTQVFKALEENGIEIPYKYMNVIVKKEA